MEKPIDFDLIFNQDGTVECPWWSPEIESLLEKLGTPAEGFELLNKNPWCG